MKPFPVRAIFGHSASPATTTRERKSRVLFGCLALTLLTLFSCAKPVPPPDWQLGREGQTLYYFLVQLEASASGDAETFALAAKKLLELEPAEAAYLSMAELSLRRNHLEEARITARNGLAVFPASLPLALIISDSYLQQEKFDDAAQTLLFFLKINPDNQDALQELARTYLIGERYAAFDALLHTIPAKKMTPYLRYVKARALLNRNHLAKGEKELRLVVRDAPDMIDAWVNLGLTLQMQGKYVESLPMFRTALEGDLANPSLWLRMVDAELKAKQPEQALKTMREAPASPTFQVEAAMLFIETKYYRTARTLLQEVRDMPDAPEVVHIYLAALALENMNNPSEALQELAQISPRSPLAERALRWRLQILEEAGRIRDCVPIAREHAEKNPDSAEFQIIYAQVTSIVGDKEGAVSVLQNAHAKWPDNTSVAFHLASHLDAFEKREEALQLMEFVVAKDPRNAMALNYVGYILAEENRELERAHALLVRAVMEAPEDPHIADSMAWVLYKMGDFNNAWEAIKKSIALGGNHPTIWEHYGDIALKIGKKEEARKAYTNALKLDPDNPEGIQTKLREIP